MNKFGIALVVACLMALTAGTALAEPFTFIDTMSFGNGQLITNSTSGQNPGPFTYQHDLLNAEPPVDVDVYEVLEANLKLQFSDTDSDQGYWVWWWWYVPGEEEVVKVTFDGSEWQNIGDVDTEWTDSIAVNVDLLNYDGLLSVKVEVTNSGGDVCLLASELSGTAQVVPVPGAVLLGVLGLGAAGMKLRRRNAA